MLDLHDLIRPSSVLTGVGAVNKKKLLAQIGTAAEREFGLPSRLVADALGDRERLGTTGFGAGIAIPHGRVAGIERISGLFLRLDRPIDFEAIDDLPVDLVFVLLSPPDVGSDHLKALARVSRALRDRNFAAKLRGAGSPDAMYALFTTAEARDAA